MSAAESFTERDHANPLALLRIRFEREVVPRSEDRVHPPRFYSMGIEAGRQLSFDGRTVGFVLVVTRGRLGGPNKDESRATVRREEFATLARAVERWGHLAALRRAHGYREIPPRA
jgi:hypothetical protein